MILLRPAEITGRWLNKPCRITLPLESQRGTRLKIAKDAADRLAVIRHLILLRLAIRARDEIGSVECATGESQTKQDAEDGSVHVHASAKDAPHLYVGIGGGQS
jgi:hypothetical protein